MPIKAKAKPASGKASPASTKVAGTNKKAAAAKATAPMPEAKFQSGTFLLFSGYPKDATPGMFEAGEKVFLHSTPLEDHPKIKNRKIRVYICVKEADAEQAGNLTYEQLGADDSPVQAEELGSGVLKSLPPEPEVWHPKAAGEVAVYVAAGNLTDRIKSLFEQEQATHFAIGGLLAFVRHEHIEEVAALGYRDTEEDGKTVTAWQNYLRAEFDISHRTADEYIGIYRAFSELPNFTPDMISGKDGIGWSKAALLVSYLPRSYDEAGEEQKKAEALIKLAQETPIRDLRTQVKEQFAADGTTPAGTSTRTGARAGGRGATVKSWTFKLGDAAATSVQKIFELAAKDKGMPEDSPQLFEAIVTEWADNFLSPANKNRLAKASGAPTTGVSRVAPRGPSKAPTKAPADTSENAEQPSMAAASAE